MLARWRTARMRAHPGYMNERVCSWDGLANHRDNSLQLRCVALRIKAARHEDRRIDSVRGCSAIARTLDKRKSQ